MTEPKIDNEPSAPCNCLDELTKAIKKHYGEEAYVETVGTMNFKTMVAGRELPPPYLQHKVKGKWKRIPIRTLYCQMCGRKL